MAGPAAVVAEAAWLPHDDAVERCRVYLVVEPRLGVHRAHRLPGRPRMTREVQARGLRGSREAIDALAADIASGR